MTTDDKDMLIGRYHAREVTTGQLNRRRIEAAENLAAAKKAYRKLKEERPEDASEVELGDWHRKLGKQGLEIDRLTAEKAAAEQEFNRHVGSKSLPLFGTEPDVIARDCISGGIVLLLEQGCTSEDIRETMELELTINAARFAVEHAAEQSADADAQATLFPQQRDRDETERALAYLLGQNLPRPMGFGWLEVVAHFTDDEIDAAWSWATMPQSSEQPACIADVLAGNVDRFEHDPGLPANIYTVDAADARLGDHLAAEIDETGRVVVTPRRGGPPQEVGRLRPSQTMIPVFAAVRLIAAADPRWRTTREDWTWNGREEARAEKEAIRLPPKRAKKDGATADAANDSTPHPLDDIPVPQLLDALRQSGGSLTAAGAILGITRDAMRRRCERAGIDYKAMKS